jgi:hypothetical protein
MGDWLGTGFEHPSRRLYLPFDEAKEYVHGLNFDSSHQWHDYCNSGDKPEHIPSNPQKVYRDNRDGGWTNMGDWLGTGRKKSGAIEWRPFDAAREYVRRLNLKKGRELNVFKRSDALPEDIPKKPDNAYKHEWEGMSDWLGNNYVSAKAKRDKYKNFYEAREWARSKGLKSGKEWDSLCKRRELPEDIPRYPKQSYQNRGWNGINDWLGTEKEADLKDFESARQEVRSRSIATMKDYHTLHKKGCFSSGIPVYPGSAYRDNGWKGPNDWLGTGKPDQKDIKYREFELAREFARSLGLKTQAEWIEFTKTANMPSDIPVQVRDYYNDKGWLGIPDWLGSGRISNHDKSKQHRPFKEARTYAHNLGLKTWKQWVEFAKSGEVPGDIPTWPDQAYRKKGWVSYLDWIGAHELSYHDRPFRSFLEARYFVRGLNLRNQKEWQAYASSGQRPRDIPADPRRNYKDDWIGIRDWLCAE